MYVFPNPTNDKVTISFGGLEATSLKIYDLSGKVIFNKTEGLTQITELSLEGIAHGMYHVKIATPMGEITKTLMKN
jgi:Secretion system C-terminal sorting domain